MRIPISPLQMDCIGRDYYGHYDAYVAGQLAPLYDLTCYQPKFFKAPALDQEVIASGGVANCGLKLAVGSLVYGFYLPALVETQLPKPFAVQITDASLGLTWWDEPIPSVFLSNFKPAGLSAAAVPAAGAIFSFPNLLCRPVPIVGNGQLNIDLWNTGPDEQRIELVLGVLEVKHGCEV